jgi:hypothetical protein
VIDEKDYVAANVAEAARSASARLSETQAKLRALEIVCILSLFQMPTPFIDQSGLCCTSLVSANVLYLSTEQKLRTMP